jgi:glycosyltransferase involved in cell wall biosynthesis
MKVAYLCADPGVRLGARKGASIHLEEFAHALRRAGAEVVVFVGEIRQPRAGIDSRAVALDPLEASTLEDLERTTSEGGKADPAALEIAQVLRDRAFERALEEEHARAPFGAVVERLSLFSLAGLRFARRHGLPFVLEVNAPLAEEQERWRVLALGALARAVERRLHAESDLVVCVSPPLRARAIELGASPGRVAVLANGVDPSLFHPGVAGEDVRRRLRLESGFVVGFLGSLRPWHGIDFLLDAAAATRGAIPSIRVLVVGEGPESAAAQARAVDLGIADAVVFGGWVDHEEVPSHLAACDVVVAPYPPIEPFYFSPMKLVEAMAVGRAVVAPDLPALSNLLRHEENALLYRPGDLAALARSLVRLGRDEALRRRLGERAARETLAERTWDRNAAFVLERAANPASRR